MVYSTKLTMAMTSLYYYDEFLSGDGKIFMRIARTHWIIETFSQCESESMYGIFNRDCYDYNFAPLQYNKFLSRDV